MNELNLPLTSRQISGLQLGQSVYLTGTVVTARDMAHRYMVEEKPDHLREVLRGSVIYHCGPLVTPAGDHWQVLAAGPTTSSRNEPYTPQIIAEYALAGVMGKGGMGESTRAACREHCTVYLHAVGGAAALLAQRIRTVRAVYKLHEFGIPEAIWVLQVHRFPAVVTIDSAGNSLHEQVRASSAQAEQDLLESVV